jgi:hypothetical protein
VLCRSPENPSAPRLPLPSTIPGADGHTLALGAAAAASAAERREPAWRIEQARDEGIRFVAWP